MAGRQSVDGGGPGRGGGGLEAGRARLYGQVQAGVESGMNDNPRLQVASGRVVLTGQWTLAAMLPDLAILEDQLAGAGRSVGVWDLSGISRLDSAAAVLLWRTWGNAWPATLEISTLHRQVLTRVAELPQQIPGPPVRPFHPLEVVGLLTLKALANLRGMIALFGQLLLDLGYLFRYPGDIP